MTDTFDFLVRTRRLFAAAVLVLAASVPATMAHAQQVVVIVNGDPITALDIEQRSKLIQLSTHKAPARQQVIEELINDRLKVREAKKFGLEVTAAEVDAAFATMAGRMRRTRRAIHPGARSVRRQRQHPQSQDQGRRHLATARARALTRRPSRSPRRTSSRRWKARPTIRSAMTTRCGRSFSSCRPARPKPSSKGGGAKRRLCADVSRAARTASPSRARSRTSPSANRSSAARPTYRRSFARCSRASRSAS